MQEGWSLYEKPWEGVGTENCESYLQKVTILPKVFKYGPSIILGYKPNIIRGKISWFHFYGFQGMVYLKEMIEQGIFCFGTSL